MLFFCVCYKQYIYFSAVNTIKVCQKSSYFILPTPVFATLEAFLCAQDWFVVITAERELMDLP